jgi:uncharacterized protein YaaR (DUF327 family)
VNERTSLIINGRNTIYIKQWKNAVKDFIEYEHSEDFRLEIQKTSYDGWDNNLDYFEIYPYDETKLLPKYVQKYVHKLLKAKEVA